MNSKSAELAPDSYSQSIEIAVLLLLAILSMVVWTVWPSTHQAEVVENVVFGVVGGLFVGMLLVVAAVPTSAIINRLSTLGSHLRFAAFLLGMIGFTLVLVFLVARGLGKPWRGLVFMILAGVPLPALFLAYIRIYGRFPNYGWGLLLAVVGATATLIFSCPLAAKPSRIQSGDPRENDLIVLSWNLGIGQPASAPSQAKYLTAMAESIRSSGAHVAALQEVDHQAHLDVLLAELGPPWRGEISRDDRMVTGILARVPGKFTRWQTEFPYGGPVGFVLENPTLEIVSVHFPPEGSSKVRLEYARWLRKRIAETSHPVAVAGDLNVDPDGWWDRQCVVFTDSVPRDQEVLSVLGDGSTDVGRAGSATAALSRRLDCFFLPGGFDCVDYQVLHDQKHGRMDHHPILIRIRHEMPSR